MNLHRTKIAAATGAATAIEKVTSNNPCTFVGYGFSGADSVAVEVSYDSGTNFVACYKNGVAVTIASTNNPVTVYGPGIFRLNKGVTTGSVGVVAYYEP